MKKNKKENVVTKTTGDIIKQVICGSPDRPLIIGDIEIQCYVLEDETRVLSQRGLLGGIGMSTGAQRRLSGLISRLASHRVYYRRVSPIRKALEDSCASATLEGPLILP